MASRIAQLVLVVSFLCVAVSAGQEKGAPVKYDTAALNKSLREVINTGADLFNLQGDYVGCYRLYQGSLMAIKPLLPADMQQNVGKALADAEKKPTYADRAHHLRLAIDSIRTQMKMATTAAPPLPVPPPPPPVLKKMTPKGK
jgi:hypothetical protein